MLGFAPSLNKRFAFSHSTKELKHLHKYPARQSLFSVGLTVMIERTRANNCALLLLPTLQVIGGKKTWQHGLVHPSRWRFLTKWQNFRHLNPFNSKGEKLMVFSIYVSCSCTTLKLMKSKFWILTMDYREWNKKLERRFKMTFLHFYALIWFQVMPQPLTIDHESSIAKWIFLPWRNPGRIKRPISVSE